MTAQSEAFDPIGPGTPAWEASDAAINHGVMGRTKEMQEALNTMTRHLLDNNATAQEIGEWEAHVAERVTEKHIDDTDEHSPSQD